MKSKVILTSVESILFLIILFILIVNFKAQTTSALCISFSGSRVLLSTFFVIFASYVIGVVSGMVYSLVLGDRYKDQIEFYARKNEKLSQQNEIDTDDKEALQRKIATLEIALNNALKNKEK
jgi:uncharacterized integral membrane protein